MQTKNLYHKVIDQLKSDIFASLQEGKVCDIPSERTLAQNMGVSGITVRQAIKSLANQGIITTRHRSGAYVSQEVIDSHKTVAVILGHRRLDNLRSPWHLLVYHGLCESLEKAGWNIRSYTVYHGTSEIDNHVMDKIIEDAETWKFSGVISFPEFSFLRPGFQSILDKLGIRYLNFDLDSSSNAVVPDYHALGMMCVDFLYRQGIQKIGFIGSGPNRPDYFGFMQAVKKNERMQTREEWIRCPEPSINTGIKSFEEIWSFPEKPEGLVVCDDVSFLGITMAMLKLNVHHPENIKLIVHGVQDAVEHGIFSPPRILFSPGYCAGFTVNQLRMMIREKISTIPTVRFAPISTEDDTQNHKVESEHDLDNEKVRIMA